MSDFWQDESENDENTSNNNPFGSGSPYGAGSTGSGSGSGSGSGTGTGTGSGSSSTTFTKSLLSTNNEISFVSLIIAMITIFAQLVAYHYTTLIPKAVNDSTWSSLLPHNMYLSGINPRWALSWLRSQKITQFGITAPLYLYNAITLLILFLIMYLAVVYMPRIFTRSSKIRVTICYATTFIAIYIILMAFTSGIESNWCILITVLLYLTCLITRLAQDFFEKSKFLGVFFWICQILLITYTSLSLLLVYC